MPQVQTNSKFKGFKNAKSKQWRDGEPVIVIRTKRFGFSRTPRK